MDSAHEENLRIEALKFVEEVRQTFLHTNDFDSKWSQFEAALKLFHDGITTKETLVQTLIDLFHGHDNLLSGYRKFIPAGIPQTETPLEKSREFLRAVQERFGEKNAGSYRSLVDFLVAHGEGRLGRCELYRNVCKTLVGNPDLFAQFESTFFNDGREETKRELKEFRGLTKHDILRNMTGTLELCASTIKTLKEAPEKLTADHRSYIGEVLPRGFQLKDKDPVLALLEKRQHNNFRKARTVVIPYVNQIFSNPI